MKNFFKTFTFAILIALIFRFSVASPYKIPTGSMIPTLKIGDFIFVSKLSYALKLPFTNYNLIEYKTAVGNTNYPYGRGVLPDYVIHPASIDIYKNIDTELEYALNLIRTKK